LPFASKNMQQLRGSLPPGFFTRLEKELGRETTLRLLWPAIVGAGFAANSQLKAIKGSKLIVALPDRSWLGSLGEIDSMILKSVNRIAGSGEYRAVEFVVDAASFPQRAGKAERIGAMQVTAPVMAGIDASPIGDGALRDMFSNSARKYFARQQARQKLSRKHGPEEEPLH